MLNMDAGRIVRFSSIYETPPYGKTDQDDFLNWVVEIRTFYMPSKLLHIIKDIENRLGRQKREHWGPREIDIDILFYGDRKVDTSELFVPHPETHKRLFVVIPICEIDESFMHPKVGEQMSIIRLQLERENPDWDGKVYRPKNEISLY